jgi:hypothetical protein
MTREELRAPISSAFVDWIFTLFIQPPFTNIFVATARNARIA